MVLVETLVLGRQERRLDVRGHFPERNDGSPLEAEIGNQPAVSRIELGSLVWIVGAQLINRRAGVARTRTAPGSRQESQAQRKGRQDSDQDSTASPGRDPDVAKPDPAKVEASGAFSTKN